MTYAEAVAWLDRLIDYEKQPSFQYATAFKLDRVHALMDALGHPERSFPALHIAGTKGKGSVAAYLDALLRAHGYRTGLYTSPHLVSFRERVRIDGAKIAEDEFAAVMSRIVPWADEWQAGHPEDRLSFFDVLTGVGFAAFRGAKVDWGVVEVGMGGRLDATNVLTPRVAIIMPVALEHTKYLGNTIAEIAGEKAGIIKPGAPVVVGRQTDEGTKVIARKCEDVGAQATWMGRDVPVDGASDPWTLTIDGVRYDGLSMGMLGEHQRWNFAAAVTALHRAEVSLDPAAVVRVARETIVPGRLHVFRGAPTIMLDVAHTPDSAERLVAAIEEGFPAHAIGGATLVFACSRDKRVADLASILARTARRVHLAAMPGIRSMPLDEMLAAWNAAHRSVAGHADIAEAFEAARAETTGNGLVVVCGSFILVGAVMKLLGYEPE